MSTHLTLPSLLAMAVVGLGPQAQAQAITDPPPLPQPLRILLTNDDGVAGSGMRILRDTLCAAGHQVTVVAPSADRSGSSGSLGLNVTIRATRTDFTCGTTLSSTWAVGGSPSDSVLFGLSILGAQQRPDLVISGMNSGHNVGRAVNHSGTVGAAVTAAEEGIPAMAVSISVNVLDAGTGFSQTAAAAPHAAAFVSQFITKLRTIARPGEGLIPDRVALNINYPVVLSASGLFDPALVRPTRVTVVGHGEVVHPQYMPIPNQPDLYFASGPICGLSVACAPETVPYADTSALEEGAISATPIAVDGAVRLQYRTQLQWRLDH